MARKKADPIQFRHPAWCDPAHCTGDPAETADTSNGVNSGEHRSAPIPLTLPGVFWQEGPAKPVIVFLSQAITPWTCEVFLRVGVGSGQTAYLPLPEAHSALQAASDLIARAMPAQVTS